MQDNFYLPMFIFRLSLNRIQGRMIIPVWRRFGGKNPESALFKKLQPFFEGDHPVPVIRLQAAQYFFNGILFFSF